MDSTSILIEKAAGLALAAIAMAGPQKDVQPTIWTALADEPPQVNVFYDRDATRSAHRWQAAHWGQYAATIMTSDGGLTIDGVYQRALIMTARVRARGYAEMRYVLPYQSDGVHLAVFPMMVMVHGGCNYLPPDTAQQIFNNLQQEVDSYGVVGLSFADASLSQAAACSGDRSV